MMIYVLKAELDTKSLFRYRYLLLVVTRYRLSLVTNTFWKVRVTSLFCTFNSQITPYNPTASLTVTT
jgi:hypothetical protein